MTTSRIVSTLAGSLLAASSFASASASAPAREEATPVPILMYHVIGDPPSGAPYPELYVSRPDFEAQMRWLARHGYQAVTQREVWNHWHRGGALPRRAIVITFDDGYRSVADRALPSMQARGWPGVLNLTVKNLRVQRRPERVACTEAHCRRLGTRLALADASRSDGPRQRHSHARDCRLAPDSPIPLRSPGRLLLLPGRSVRRSALSGRFAGPAISEPPRRSRDSRDPGSRTSSSAFA